MNLTININDIDNGLKRDAEGILSELGLDFSTATMIFLRQVVRCRGLPFDMRISSVYTPPNWACPFLDKARNAKDAE